MRLPNYEKLARRAKLIQVKLEFPLFEDTLFMPSFKDFGDNPQAIRQNLETEYDELCHQLEEAAKVHIRDYIPVPAIGSRNVCAVHLYKVGGKKRSKVLRDIRSLDGYQLIMVEDAIHYFLGINRYVERGMLNSALLTHNGEGELIDHTFYEMFRNTTNLVCGCYKECCVDTFARKLKEFAPRKVEVVDRWTFSFSDRQKEIYVQ